MTDALLAELHARGDLAANAPPPAPEHVESRWVLALQIAGGWLAAIFLLLFLGAGSAALIHSASGWLIIGVLLTTAAGFGLRRDGGPLYRQFLLALSLAGQGAVLFGLADWKHGSNHYHAYLFAAFEAAVFIAVPWAPHRLFAAWLGLFILSMASGRFSFDISGSHMLPIIALYWLAACLLAVNEARWRCLRIAPALALLLAALLLNVLQFCATTLYRPFSASHTFSGLADGWLLVALSGLTLLAIGNEVWRGTRAGLAALLLIAVLALTWRAPGIAVGLTILALGFRRGQHWLMWAGGLLALIAVNRFYYDLQIDLLEKSALLAAGGMLILLLRIVLSGASLKTKEQS